MNEFLGQLIRAAYAVSDEACTSCVHMNACKVNGCHVIKMAAELLAGMRWRTDPADLPNSAEDACLVIVNGKDGNITLDHAYEMAIYDKKDGWILDYHPDCEELEVLCWVPLSQLLPPPDIEPIRRDAPHIKSARELFDDMGYDRKVDMGVETYTGKHGTQEISFVDGHAVMDYFGRKVILDPKAVKAMYIRFKERGW